MAPRRLLTSNTSVAVKKNGDEMEHSVLSMAEQSLGYQIRYAYRIFVKTLADELGPHRITTGQWSALRVLWEQEGLSQVELAQKMMVEKASLTAVLKAMAGQGLITRVRNSNDRRKLNIYLTASGRRLKSKIMPLIGKINKRATRRLSPPEVRQLQALLVRVMMNLQH
jgi:MarR family transcriptional regulator, organic hydroperoxide resistance regulator